MQHNQSIRHISGKILFLLLTTGLSACIGITRPNSMIVVDPIASTATRSSTPLGVEPSTSQPVVLSVTTTAHTPTSLPATSALTQEPLELLADPHSDVVIISPGSKSSIRSPLKPEVFIKVQEEGIVQIELIGKGEQIFARQILDLHSQSGQDTVIHPLIPFEITKSSEAARLVVRLIDSSQRVVSSASANLTLLSSGGETIQSTTGAGSILITSPTAGEQIGGSKVHITASVVPINDEPIIAELLTDDGAAINTKLVYLPASEGLNQSATLDVTIPYSVKTITPCRVTLYQASYNQIQGTLMLSSILITLLP
jgi:hypothetical protein